MSTMTDTKGRRTRRFTDDYKTGAVRLVLDGTPNPGIWNADSDEVERSSERSDDWSASNLHQCRNGLSISYT